MWRVIRRWNPEGRDLGLNVYMKQMRKLLHEVGAELEKL